MGILRVQSEKEKENWREQIHAPSPQEVIFYTHVLGLSSIQRGLRLCDGQVTALAGDILYVNMYIHIYMRWHAFQVIIPEEFRKVL